MGVFGCVYGRVFGNAYGDTSSCGAGSSGGSVFGCVYGRVFGNVYGDTTACGVETVTPLPGGGEGVGARYRGNPLQAARRRIAADRALDDEEIALLLPMMLLAITRET